MQEVSLCSLGSIVSIDLTTDQETARGLEFLEVYGHCCFQPMAQTDSPHLYVADPVYAGGQLYATLQRQQHSQH